MRQPVKIYGPEELPWWALGIVLAHERPGASWSGLFLFDVIPERIFLVGPLYARREGENRWSLWMLESNIGKPVSLEALRRPYRTPEWLSCYGGLVGVGWIAAFFGALLLYIRVVDFIVNTVLGLEWPFVMTGLVGYAVLAVGYFVWIWLHGKWSLWSLMRR